MRNRAFCQRTMPTAERLRPDFCRQKRTQSQRPSPATVNSTAPVAKAATKMWDSVMAFSTSWYQRTYIRSSAQRMAVTHFTGARKLGCEWPNPVAPFGQPLPSRDEEPFPRLCRTYFARSKSIFHAQSPFLNVPSNLFSMNFPVRGCQPIVAPKAPSVETLPLIFGASSSNRATPVTSLPWTLNSTLAGLHRATLDVAEPTHLPS